MILFGTEITWDPKHQKSFEKGGNKNVYVNKDILHVSNFDSILVPRAMDTLGISLRYNFSN